MINYHNAVECKNIFVPENLHFMINLRLREGVTLCPPRTTKSNFSLQVFMF